jgi:hypothetical protein
MSTAMSRGGPPTNPLKVDDAVVRVLVLMIVPQADHGRINASGLLDLGGEVVDQRQQGRSDVLAHDCAPSMIARTVAASGVGKGPMLFLAQGDGGIGLPRHV